MPGPRSAPACSPWCAATAGTRPRSRCSKAAIVTGSRGDDAGVAYVDTASAWVAAARARERGQRERGSAGGLRCRGADAPPDRGADHELSGFADASHGISRARRAVRAGCGTAPVRREAARRRRDARGPASPQPRRSTSLTQRARRRSATCIRACARSHSAGSRGMASRRCCEGQRWSCGRSLSC
jgi:hypothetical protein